MAFVAFLLRQQTVFVLVIFSFHTLDNLPSPVIYHQEWTAPITHPIISLLMCSQSLAKLWWEPSDDTGVGHTVRVLPQAEIATITLTLFPTYYPLRFQYVLQSIKYTAVHLASLAKFISSSTRIATYSCLLGIIQRLGRYGILLYAYRSLDTVQRIPVACTVPLGGDNVHSCSSERGSSNNPMIRVRLMSDSSIVQCCF